MQSRRSTLRTPSVTMRGYSGRTGRAAVLTAAWLLGACVCACAAVPAPRQNASNSMTVTAEAPPAEDPGFTRARAVADEVLKRPEFQRNVSLTWWQQKREQLLEMLYKLFARVNRIGHAAPWLARVLEWLFFTAAAGTLVWFVLRQLARHRLRVAQSETLVTPEIWKRESSDWAQRAEAFAAAEAWRDAVHCLYWAAIVLLESRRAWRHNPTRTPREYVRLLKAGSPQQQNLRGLTRIFERSWYGLRAATAAEYAEASGFYAGLMHSSGANNGQIAGAMAPKLGAEVL